LFEDVIDSLERFQKSFKKKNRCTLDLNSRPQLNFLTKLMNDIINFIQQQLQKWSILKSKIESKVKNPPSVKEGQIWWAIIGQNIGSEIFGKGQTFSRPVIIYKKLSKYTFLVIPTSTKIKTGSWYCGFYHSKKEMVAVLSQIRVIDYKRLENQIGDIDNKDFNNIKKAFLNLYK
jgi:mRNA interferase MazF